VHTYIHSTKCWKQDHQEREGLLLLPAFKCRSSAHFSRSEQNYKVIGARHWDSEHDENTNVREAITAGGADYSTSSRCAAASHFSVNKIKTIRRPISIQEEAFLVC
jgi:hypothetical protein